MCCRVLTRAGHSSGQFVLRSELFYCLTLKVHADAAASLDLAAVTTSVQPEESPISSIRSLSIFSSSAKKSGYCFLNIPKSLACADLIRTCTLAAAMLTPGSESGVGQTGGETIKGSSNGVSIDIETENWQH